MKEWEWQLVNDHIKIFKSHRLKKLSPQEGLYLDVSFSRWYGFGGDWINPGMPNYVQMDHKPQYGYKIQDT